MFSTVDVTQIDRAPVRDNKPENALFTIAFVTMCSFFALNLFNSAVIDNYRRMKRRLVGSAFLTTQQQRWLNVQQILLKLKPPSAYTAPESRIRKTFFRVATNSWFGYAVDVVTVVNTVALMATHYQNPPQLAQYLEVSSWIFEATLLFEVGVKLVGLGFVQYFAPYTEFSWNKLDFAVSLLSVIGTPACRLPRLACSQSGSFSATGVSLGVNSTFERTVRVLRLLRLIRYFRRLEIVFQTFWFSLSSIVDIGILLFVIFYLFAIFGMYFFGSLPFSSRAGLNEQVSFGNFGVAMLTLFRLATKDTWPFLMFDVVQPNGCLSDYPAADGSSIFSQCSNTARAIYFVVFIFIIVFVVLNLFLAVLLDKFNELSRMADLLKKWPNFNACAPTYFF
jgi:hypothetical protein